MVQQRTVATVSDPCPVCGASLAERRVAHLRSEHPEYWRTVVVRLAAPGVFLGLVLVLSSLGTTWAVATLAAAGLIATTIWARRRSAAIRGVDGFGISRAQWLRGAGIGLLGAAAALGFTQLMLAR
jgi:hypothetical protein